MIKLEDFIVTPDINKTKVKFNMNASDANMRAWDLLLEDRPDWIYMNQWRNKSVNHNLDNSDYLIALAQYYPYGPEYFIFGGLYKVTKIEPEVIEGFGYEISLMEDYQEYIKRLIIKIKKPLQRSTYNRNYSTLQAQLNPEVYEVAPNTKIGNFPGYQNVSLTHKELTRIIDEPVWKKALSYVKGIYVITDISDGRLYIGSAYGENGGIWQRWAGYADKNNLSNGNKDFDIMIETKGRQHIEHNFRYSILEIFDTKTIDSTIIERESYWKKVFDTRKHGMNWN